MDMDLGAHDGTIIIIILMSYYHTIALFLNRIAIVSNKPSIAFMW